MSKLKFIIDQEYDSRMIFVMLQNQSDSGLKYQAQAMELDLELAKKISKGTDYDQVKTDIDQALTSFWPWDKSGSYTDHNYPEIADLQIKLTEIYQKEGFESFIKQGIKSFSKR